MSITVSGLALVKPFELDDDMPQSPGLRRLESVARLLLGACSPRAAVVQAEPGAAGPVHHHGPQGTVVYVLSGEARVRWGDRLQHEADLSPGDFLFIAPGVPHREINASRREAARWLVVRGAPEDVFVPLTEGLDGEYREVGPVRGRPA